MTTPHALAAAAFAAMLTTFTSPPASAQGQGTAAAEGFAGYAGFLDDSTITHTVVGGSARWYLLPRVAIGPEAVYFRGPRNDRDLTVTGNVTFDLLPAARAATPFLVAGAGLFQHSDRFGSATFTSTEGAFTGGGGVRISIGRQFYVAPEFRIGWRRTSGSAWRPGGGSERGRRAPSCKPLRMRNELSKRYDMLDNLDTAMLTTRRRDGHLMSERWPIRSMRRAPTCGLSRAARAPSSTTWRTTRTCRQEVLTGADIDDAPESRGSRIVKVAPCPLPSLVAAMVPPCSSTRWRTSDSPKAEPRMRSRHVGVLLAGSGRTRRAGTLARCPRPSR